jgi:hypothetical protein
MSMVIKSMFYDTNWSSKIIFIISLDILKCSTFTTKERLLNESASNSTHWEWKKSRLYECEWESIIVRMCHNNILHIKHHLISFRIPLLLHSIIFSFYTHIFSVCVQQHKYYKKGSALNKHSLIHPFIHIAW